MVDPTGKDVWCAISQRLIVFGICALWFGLKGEHCNWSRAQMNGQNGDSTVNVVVRICSQMTPVFWPLGRLLGNAGLIGVRNKTRRAERTA